IDAPVSGVQEQDLPFDVYPNPASGEFFVNNFPSEGEVAVYDLSGNRRLAQQVSAGDNSIGIGTLQDGMYFVDFQSNGGSFRHKLIIKN
ncbi:MAG: T9SS type A sorting domain-containing protein, partial [Bacteroidetes bacterium]|nr:T9SS type A sorting domain-containing protein [Bacteroidota bacterium]